MNASVALSRPTLEENDRITAAVASQGPRLRAFVRRQVADLSEVDDIVQDAFVQLSSWAKQDVNGAQVQEMIRNLVSHHVAVTSTLPVFEAHAPGRPTLQPRTLDAMSAESAQSYLTDRARVALDSPITALLRKEMDFEVAFVKAGGLLLAGPDPTGNGGVLPGFGDQREIELLVEAGFTPVEAIHIATENGALYLGQQDRIGTLASGKQADLVLIKGDPSKRIDEIENVETVFKAGIGYDSKKLIDSVRGQVGIR